MQPRSRESNTSRSHALEAESDDTCSTRHVPCGNSQYKTRRASRRSKDSPSETPLGAPKHHAQHLKAASAWIRHVGDVVVDTEVVALSSAESEYHSMVRCASEASGMANTIRELGHEAHERIWTGALGARGMALRSVSGAIKHMET